MSALAHHLINGNISNMLKISNLTLGYEGKAVLQFSGVELENGSEWLITGASGCGKTTLLYSIAGLMPVMAGEISVNGVNIAKLSEVQRDRFRGKNIGMIFQTLHLVKHLTVLDNLLLAANMTGEKQDITAAKNALAQLGIADKADTLPENLSQGQAQRVAIARAILHKPSLILADEPTSSLDDASCAAVLAMLKNAAKETGATLIISTHDGRVKSEFSNIICLDRGAK